MLTFTKIFVPNHASPQTVRVRVNYVARALQNLNGTSVDVCCVVGFPQGTHPLEAKLEYSHPVVYLPRHPVVTFPDTSLTPPTAKSRQPQPPAPAN